MRIPEKKELKPLGQEVYTDGSLVYKFYKDYYERHKEIEVEALRRVKDIPGTQQIVDYDEKAEVLVTQLVKGHLLNENSPEFQTGIFSYTRSQLCDLFRTLVAMKKKGVTFETHCHNLFYRKRGGFTPIDYSIPKKASIDLETIVKIIGVKSVYIHREGLSPCLASGKYPERHQDMREMIYSAFTEADATEAGKAIRDLEQTAAAMQQMFSHVRLGTLV